MYGTFDDLHFQKAETMKGIQGLIVAAGLGVSAAILNYAYLHNESQKLNMVYFIAVKPGTTIAAASVLRPTLWKRWAFPRKGSATSRSMRSCTRTAHRGRPARLPHAFGRLDVAAGRYPDPAARA